jgi:aminopeptidase N
MVPGKTDLSGLYFRDKMLCTHCEPTGFSQITYYMDRPDNTAVFDVRMEASKTDFPLLLSNGKVVARGNCTNDERRHYVVYNDPHPKPCYIFALVAARYLQVCAKGAHTTMTGRHVNITIYSEPEAVSRMDFALAALQQAMAWDEATYGISYDLDDYVIVAARHFHIGAMENRGLNLFQTSLIACAPDITTDVTYDLVAKTVAHEYFHHAFGNRVTVQSWREFGLKEGLTVFRDQEFTAGIGLRTTARIEAVKILHEKQFREDASPTTRHAVRPEQVTVSLDSLASSTTYHKGAEVCRMFQTVLGKRGFRQGLNLYLNRHDGTGATWDDFRNAMAEANSIDLDQLGLWYSTAGTPMLKYKYTYDKSNNRLSLTFTQTLACNPGIILHIPIAMGLLDKVTGDEVLPTTVLEVKNRSATFTFDNLPNEVVPSLLRDFSAPIVLIADDLPQQEANLPFLAAYDTDGFSRWKAFQNLYAKCIYSIMRNETPSSVEDHLFNAFERVLNDTNIDDATKSHLLELPTESVLLRPLEREDPAGIHHSRRELGRRLRSRFKEDIEKLYLELTCSMPLNASLTDTNARAARSLRNVLLDYLCFVDESSDDVLEVAACAMRHFDSATCLTDRLAAFRKLSSMTGKASNVREEAIEKFYQYSKLSDPVVLNKWFQTQALSALPDVLDRVKQLTQHPDFQATNAGCFRSLVTSFTMNANAFHTEEGYRFIGSVLAQMDRVAPVLAVELAGKLSTWRRHSPQRANLMKTELERISNNKNISPSLSRVVRQALAD